MPTLLEAVTNLEEAARQLKTERVLAKVAAKLEKGMQRLFKAQGKDFIKRIERYRGLFTEALGPDEMNRIMEMVEADTQEEMFQAIHASSSKAMGIGMEDAGQWGVGTGVGPGAFGLDNPQAVEWLASHAADMVTNINETTRDTIGRLVKQGVEEGWSYGRTAREIKGRYSEFAIGKPQLHIQSRAHLIAITESANAYGEGNRRSIDMLIQAGLKMEHSWNSVGDENVSDGCLENEAAGWIPIDEPFPSGDEHEPRFPGCRCNVTYRRAKSRKAA